MRPVHEQEMQVRFSGGNTCLVADGEIVAYGKLEYLQRLAALPEMARALLRAQVVLSEMREPSACAAYDAVTEALVKAKVIP